MSILIKGMETPKDCAECLNIGFHYVFECVLDDVEHGERRADCPLVPVPPHGRLIDADELEPDTEWNDYYDEYTSYSKAQIQVAPSIIEAEVDDD